jgi:hypothetical protein
MANVEQGSSGNLTPLLQGVNILPYDILGNGSQTVSSSGTAVQLGTPTAITSITIRATSTNSGKIYVGTSSVDSTNGFQLSPSETVSLDISNLGTVYIDADNNGSSVTYIYLAQ